MDIRAVAAVSHSGIIGLQDSMELPWPKMKGDLAWFKQITSGTTMIAGWRTFEYLDRLGLDLESTDRKLVLYDQKVDDDPLKFLLMQYHMHKKPISIVGGAKTYQRFVPYVHKWILTRIEYVAEPHQYYVYMPHNIALPWSRGK